MGRRDLKLKLWLKQRPRLMLRCSKADRGILIGSLLQVNRYLHIGPPISTAPRVASSFAGRGAASAASIRDLHFSVSKFVSNFETVSNVKILVVNSLNILGHGPVTVNVLSVVSFFVACSLHCHISIMMRKEGTFPLQP